MGRNRTLSLCALTLSALLPAGARAMGLVGAPTDRLEAQRMDAIVWMSGPEEETLVESITVAPGAKRFVLMRAFQTAPKEIAPIDPMLLLSLESETRTLEPHHDAVKRRMFGPSVLTPLTLSFFDAPKPSEDDTPPVRVAPPAFAMFKGKVKTTTTSAVKILPVELRNWLIDAKVELTPSQHETVAAALMQDMTVVATIINRPDASQPLMVGPVMYRFAATRPVLPPFLTPGGGMPPLRIYALGDAPFGPIGRGWTWDEEPWLHAGPPDSETSLVVSRWSPLSTQASIALTRIVESRTPPTRVLRADQKKREPGYATIALEPLPAARAIPGRAGRGAWLDIVMSILLGVAPLLYAPESWLLLWFAERARSNRRPKDPPTLAEALWPIYALVVAAFWVITVPSGARAAAAVPLILSIYGLLFRDAERERGPVRVDFRRKTARLDKKTDSGKPEGPAPVTGVVGGPKTPLPIKMALAKAPASATKTPAPSRTPLVLSNKALTPPPTKAGQAAAKAAEPAAPKADTGKPSKDGKQKGPSTQRSVMPVKKK